MNKQPFYHEYQVLVTTTSGKIPVENLEDKIADFVKEQIASEIYTQREPEVLLDSVEVLGGPVEAGNPDDLL